MKAPFIWFGGKRRVASLVWDALGDVDNYVEPFAGSLAVLLGRPTWHKARCETVNDADSYLANFWRALLHDPEEVARWADWPVNETDLFARHLWLVNEGRRRIASLESDPDFYDARVAGWWVWGLNAWIGSGWCRGDGPWTLAVEHQDGEDRQLPHLGNAGRGVNRQLPHLGDAGQGVNRQLPHLGNAGQGVNRQLPHLGDAGRGVNRQLPHLGDAGRGETPARGSTASFPTSETLLAYFGELAARLRHVRVCCGDWSRVVTTGALNYGVTVGVFLDPPYLGDVRTADLYTVDDHTISVAVRDWAIENGDNRRYRIVLAGYEDEHGEHMPDTWRCHSYSASKAYGTNNGDNGRGNGVNRHKERLWFSPHCERPATLFALSADVQ